MADKKEKKEVKAKVSEFPEELYKHFVTNMGWDEDRLRRYIERTSEK
jgi:hypothetical protein